MNKWNVICIFWFDRYNNWGLLDKPLQKFLSENQINSMMEIATLCVGIIGIQEAIATKHSLLMLAILVIGFLIGVWCNIDGKFNKLGDY